MDRRDREVGAALPLLSQVGIQVPQGIRLGKSARTVFADDASDLVAPRGITNSSEVHMRVVRHLPGDLGRVALGALAIRAVPKPRHGHVFVFRGRVPGQEEPQAIFEERTPLACAHVVGEVAGRGLRRPALGSARQQSVRVKTERLAMELVPARSRHGIDDAAQHPAKFGLIAAFAHFDLAQKVVGEADALRVAGRLNHVDTVHEVGRLGSRRARQVGAVAEG